MSGPIIAALFLAAGLWLAIAGGTALGGWIGVAGCLYGFAVFRFRPPITWLAIALPFGIVIGFIALFAVPDVYGAVPHVWLLMSFAGASLGGTRWRRRAKRRAGA